ncbi:MAG: hypothetical protein LBT56_07155 [Prevotellaceae bacterium]|jgi:hypothetical protein|nr:hypothetical protein [Prevotellaceae bacterium]
MKKFLKNIFAVLVVSVLLQSCSFVGLRSTAYNAIAGIKDNSNKSFLNFHTTDSMKFSIQPFDKTDILSFGLPYIPVIPNFFLLFSYSIDNEKTDYLVIISCAKCDSMDIRDINFYRNRKK